jgi:hypothetical protein
MTQQEQAHACVYVSRKNSPSTRSGWWGGINKKGMQGSVQWWVGGFESVNRVCVRSRFGLSQVRNIKSCLFCVCRLLQRVFSYWRAFVRSFVRSSGNQHLPFFHIFTESLRRREKKIIINMKKIEYSRKKKKKTHILNARSCKLVGHVLYHLSLACQKSYIAATSIDQLVCIYLG